MVQQLLKKTALFGLLLVIILIVGGIGGVLFDRFLIPKIATLPAFSGNQILKKVTERVTIINKTEQVVVREDDSVEKIVSQPATSVVNILTVFPSAITNSLETETTSPVAGTEVVETTTGVLLTSGDYGLHNTLLPVRGSGQCRSFQRCDSADSLLRRPENTYQNSPQACR